MNFASKINGLEEMNHHEQLKNLGIYSLEKRGFFSYNECMATNTSKWFIKCLWTTKFTSNYISFLV